MFDRAGKQDEYGLCLEEACILCSCLLQDCLSMQRVSYTIAMIRLCER